MASGEVYDGVRVFPIVPVLFGVDGAHFHGILRGEAIELLNDEGGESGAADGAGANGDAYWKIIPVGKGQAPAGRRRFGRAEIRRFCAACVYNDLLQDDTGVYDKKFQRVRSGAADVVRGDGDSDIVGNHFVPFARRFIAGAGVDGLGWVVIDGDGIMDRFAVEFQQRGVIRLYVDGTRVE